MNVYLWTTELDDVALQSTWLDAIHLGTEEVWSSKEELLLAQNPKSWYELVWDGVDSLWFKFSNITVWDTSTWISKSYSWEIWISDTDYWMPPYKYLSPLPPELVTTDEIKDAMMNNWWNNLYIPWVARCVSIYDNITWKWVVDLSTYNWTPNQDWVDAHFVNTLEWNIICQMFQQSNQWETSDWTPITQITWVQIPWTYVYNNPYSLARWDANTWNTSLSRDSLYYIPWDYYNNISSGSFRAPVLGTSQGHLPFFGSAQLNTSTGMSVDVNLWKMRVLNTTKTNYSDTSTS